MKPFLLLLIPAIFSVPVARGGELTFDEFKCRITLPKEWIREEKVEIIQRKMEHAQEMPELTGSIHSLLVATDSARSRMVAIAVSPAPKSAVISDTSSLDHFMRGIIEPPMRVVKRSSIVMAGVPALRLAIELPGTSHPIYGQAEWMLCNGYSYLLMVTDASGRNPLNDPEAQKIVASFGFIGTPEFQVAAANTVPRNISMPEEGFALTMPGGWREHSSEEMANKNAAWEAGSNDGLRVVSVQAITIPASVPKPVDLHDKQIIGQIESGIKGKTIVISDRQLIRLGGQKAILFRGSMTKDSVKASVLMVMVAQGDKLYTIVGGSRSDNGSVAEVQSIIDSFHFIKEK